MPIFTRILPVFAILTLLNLSACQTTKPMLQSHNAVVSLDEDMDSDNDGVPDSKDQCPNSPFDMIIDEKGCPVRNQIIEEIEPPTVRLYFPKNQSYPYDDYKLLTQKSDKIRQDMQKILQSPLDYSKNNPDKSICVFIEGHSSKGKYGDTVKNIDLQRAVNIKQMFKEWFGFEEKNIKLKHYGTERPISPSDTPEHTTINQRVYSIVTSCR